MEEIILTKSEKLVIKVIKRHLKDKYPFKENWAKTLSPISVELWGWDANQDGNYHDYLRGIFNYLLKLYLKIEYNQSDDPIHYLSEIFYASFSKGLGTYDELPIERAITKLCGLIQCNQVITDNSFVRYNLN